MTKPLQIEGRGSTAERESISGKVNGKEGCKMPRMEMERKWKWKEKLLK